MNTRPNCCNSNNHTVMGLFWYTFPVAYIFWIVYTNICDYMIQQDLIQSKRMMLLVSGYIVLAIYIV